MEGKKIERRVSVGAVDLLNPNPLRLFFHFFFFNFLFYFASRLVFPPNSAPWLEKVSNVNTMVMVISTVTEIIKVLQSFV